MAAFGVPRTLDDDAAERAVRCGLAIVAAVERLDAELDLEPGAIADEGRRSRPARSSTPKPAPTPVG